MSFRDTIEYRSSSSLKTTEIIHQYSFEIKKQIGRELLNILYYLCYFIPIEDE